MKVIDVLNKFPGKNPEVSAAAALGVVPQTIRYWREKKNGIVPENAAYMVSAKLGLPVVEDDYK